MSRLADSLRACLLNIEADHDRSEGWRPSSAATPSLYFLYKKQGEVVGSNLNLEPSIWGRASSLGGWLRGAAGVMERYERLCAQHMSKDQVGIAVVAEGWSLTQAEEADFERIAESRRIHAHPNRRESRIVCGTLMNGKTVYTVIRFRRCNQVMIAPSEDHELTLEGAVPDGLRFLADSSGSRP